MKKNSRKVLLIVLTVCLSFLFLSMGNPVKGKVFYFEVFGQQASTVEFKADGTYAISTIVGVIETGTWVYKNNVLVMNEGQRNEVKYSYDSKAQTLTEVDAILPKVLKLQTTK